MTQQQLPPGKRELLPYAGLLLAVGGMIWQGGVMSGQVHSNTERIEQLEARNRENSVKLDDMNARGERSAAKLDFLVQQAREGDRK